MKMKFLHYFNPGHENSVLNGLPSYTPPASIFKLMRDLASLPAWYAEREDFVLVDNSFYTSYHQGLIDRGLNIASVLKESDLGKIEKLEVDMWGISPLAIRIFEGYKKAYSSDLVIPSWDEKYVYYNSRKYAQQVLIQLMEGLAGFKHITIPTFYTNIEAVEKAISISLTDLLIKSPYSSSGRGLLWVRNHQLGQSEMQILSGMLRRQGEVSIEPVYKHKLVDFAMEFFSLGNGQVYFVGYSLFSTDEKGNYVGNILQSQADISSKLCEYVDESTLESIKVKLEYIFSNTCCLDYKGCLGVDMMIYLEGDMPKIHPCVEINMRYNMGYLSLKIFEKQIFKTSSGIFQIDYSQKGLALEDHLRMQKDYPLVIEEGRVRSGYLSLSPVSDSTNYRAYILVEKS